jgi:hypothetical protein
MKSVLPFRGDDTLMYSITYDLATPESRELGSFEESGYIVEPTEGELQDILLQANRDYGIYMPVGVGSFTNPRADEDNDYFTKGHEKYYTLFINKTDGSRLNQEELDFITALLNEGKYSYDEESNRFYEWGGTPEYGIGGWIGGTLIGGFLGYQIGKSVGYGRAVQGYEGGGDIPEGYHQMPDGTIMPDSAHYGLGGLLLAGGFGAYVGYKIGRAKPKKTGFGTEKKIARKVKSKAKELTSKKKPVKAYAGGGGVGRERVNLSFNYNPSNISNEDAEKIVKQYTNDWKHDNDFDNVSFYVFNLTKEKADELKAELKMEDVFNIEIQKSDYAKGGEITTGYLHKKYGVDKDEVMQHYDFYVEQEEDNDNEPLSFDLWLQEYGEDTAIMLSDIEARKNKMANGGKVVSYKYYDKDDYDDSVTIIKPDELQAFLDDWNNTMETNYKTAKEFNSSEDYYVIEEIYYGGGETITKPKPRITPTETPTKPDKGNPYAPKVKPFPKADYLISNK